MPPAILLDRPLSWREIGAIAEGAPIALSPAAHGRVREARRRVQSIVAQDIRAYGVNTGVGALCDVIGGRPTPQLHEVTEIAWRAIDVLPGAGRVRR